MGNHRNDRYNYHWNYWYYNLRNHWHNNHWYNRHNNIWNHWYNYHWNNWYYNHWYNNNRDHWHNNNRNDRYRNYNCGYNYCYHYSRNNHCLNLLVVNSYRKGTFNDGIQYLKRHVSMVLTFN